MDYWDIKKIVDKNKFLSEPIRIVPNGSLWQTDGLNDQSIADFLKPYLTPECKNKWDALGDAEKDFFEVELTSQNNEQIADEILKWDLNKNLNTQIIISNGEEYFKSYDYLDESCTWISRKLDLDQLKDTVKLEDKN